MAKNKWSLRLDPDKHLKFSYGDQSSVTLSDNGEVINSFSTQEPINAIEHLYDIPNRDYAKTTSKLLLQSQGDELFKFVTTAELDMQLDELIDIDFTNANVADTVLVSDADGTYSFRETKVISLKDIDQNTVGNAGYTLTDVGDGTFEFQIPLLTKMTDIDFTPQDVLLVEHPLTVEGLVLTTQGDGTFDWRRPTVHIHDVSGVGWEVLPDPQLTAGLVLTTNGNGTYDFVVPSTEFTNLLGLDFATNDPLTESGRVLTSVGDGTFNFTIPQANFNNIDGIDFITNDPNNNADLHLTTTNLLDADGNPTYEFRQPKFTNLLEIDFATENPATIADLQLTSVGDGTYTWSAPTRSFFQLNNIDFLTNNPAGTEDLHLTSTGQVDVDGNPLFEFRAVHFTKLLDIDFVTNDPNNTADYVLTSVGDGTYDFKRFTQVFEDITNIDFLTNDPNTNADYQLTSTGTFDVDGNPIYEWRRTHFTNLLDIDFTTANPNGTVDLVLTSVGDGTYNWTEPVREFDDLTNIDWTNAFSTPNLVLTTDGTGSFYWDVQRPNFDDMVNVTGSTTIGDVLTVTAPNTYEFLTPERTLLSLLDTIVTVNNDPVNDAGLVLTSVGGGTSTFEFQPITIDFSQINGFNVTGDAAGAVLTSLGGGNYEWAQPSITDLIDIDLTNNLTPNAVLMTDEDGTYSLQNIDFNDLLAIDYTNNTSAGAVMIADGDGTYSFLDLLLTQMNDIDFVTNLPLTTSGMYLTTDGDGTFSWNMPNLDLFTDIDFTNDSAGNVMTANGDGTYSFTTPQLQTLADVAVGTSLTTGDLVLTSLGDGTYYFRQVNVELANLTDIDFTAPVDAATQTNAVLFAEGDGTYAFHDPMLAYLADVDDTTNSPLTTDSLVLTSVGDGTYNFQVPTIQLENVLNLDTTINDPMNTAGWSLVSDGDGTFSFQIPNMSQDYINEWDTTINSPIDTPDMYLQSNGDGTYSYNPLELNHASDIDWTAAPYPDKYVLTSDGDGTFSWREPTETFDQYIDSMLDVDHDSALHTIGGAFLDGSVLTTVANRTDGIKYEWRPASDFQIRFDNLIDVDTTQITPIQPFRTPVRADTTIPTVDVSATATQGLIMVSDGDASYSFIYPELRLMVDVDYTPQDLAGLKDPLTTSGLLMMTTGTGDYVFTNELPPMQIEDLLIGIDGPNEISTATLDLVLDSATGITTVDDILEVTSLTETRVVFVGVDGSLVDDEHFTYTVATDTLTLIGDAQIDDININGNTISTGAGIELVLDPDADAAGLGIVRIQGDLHVMGTTTTINSTTVTIDDPIFTLGGDTPALLNDTLDRGIDYQWHDGVNPKLGFFGWDESTGRFTFIPDATNTGEIISGDLGYVDFAGGAFGDIQIAVTDPDTIDTMVNDLHISSATQDVTFTANLIPTTGADGLGAGYEIGYRDPLDVDPPILWKDIHSESIQLEDTGYLREEPIATEPFAIVMAIALG